MSRPAIFRIELGVRIPIVLGAISNLALAGFYRCLFVFVMSFCVVLWWTERYLCQEEILLFGHGKVRASSDRRHKPPLRPLLVVLARYTEMR